MKKLLLPLMLLLIGTGGGVGAAMFLAPPADHPVADTLAECAPGAHLDGADLALTADAELAPGTDDPEAGVEYARLNNQFIVPIVQNDRVSALVVLSLSVEVATGQKQRVFEREPRLRDRLLQVMFDHANQGGFDGVFTASDNMGNLRTAMRNVARDSVGPEVRDVLILDVVRQEVPG